MPTVDDLEYLEALRDEAEALVLAAETAGPDAAVPSCPDWDVAALLGHVGSVHRWALANLTHPVDGPRLAISELEPAPAPGLRPAWVRAGAEALVATLGTLAADAPAWTYAPPHTAGFWRRRQTHETTMHRVDAELAASGVGRSHRPIAPELAADAVDEYLTMVAMRAGTRLTLTGAGETIHLHCTDTEGEWLLAPTPEGLGIERAHAKGDVAVRGAASDLACWLAGRDDRSALEVFGDEALADRFRRESKW